MDHDKTYFLVSVSKRRYQALTQVGFTSDPRTSWKISEYVEVVIIHLSVTAPTQLSSTCPMDMVALPWQESRYIWLYISIWCSSFTASHRVKCLLGPLSKSHHLLEKRKLHVRTEIADIEDFQVCRISRPLSCPRRTNTGTKHALEQGAHTTLVEQSSQLTLCAEELQHIKLLWPGFPRQLAAEYPKRYYQTAGFPDLGLAMNSCASYSCHFEPLSQFQAHCQQGGRVWLSLMLPFLW
ncbi:hypothetical protein QBC39DRAFT_154772 [Podospora conica]|nr:hypothetical protein QBC39DRAFT_154772 [Schizothecium conicum]